VGSAFSVMEQHGETPRPPSPGGRLVLSRLTPGQTMIAAHAPSLKLVLEGEEIYTIDGRDIRVLPGQFLYLGAGDHCFGTNRIETLGLCLALPRDWAAAPGADGHDPVFGRSLVLSTQGSAMGRALERYGRRIAGDPASGTELASDIIAQADAAIGEPLGHSRAAIQALALVKASTRRSLFQRLERARGFLHANDGRTVTLGELAAIASLSQFHLARYFRLAFGQPPITYHRTLRLERAVRYLKREEGTIAEAAELAGYSDSVALCHAFRRHFGKAPRAWLADESGLRTAA
jgi:AraC-like DNA-binding protein